jgi:hypothetical protein
MIRKLFFFREHIVCTVFVVLSMALAHAQEATSPKVQKTSNNQVFAILANGMASESARQFQALLEVELGQAAGAELVERQQLGKVFEERRIAKIFSDEDGWRQTFAQSGLTGVSLFILVESTTSAELAENETTIRVRLVEPRWGIKLGDFRLSISDEKSLERSISASLAKILAAGNSAVHLGDSPVVAVLPFVNIDPSEQWNGLGEAMQAGIERTLCTRQNLIVLERKHGGPLAEERELIATLPPAIATSMVVVEGEYGSIGPPESQQIELALRLRNANSAKSTVHRIRMSPEQLAAAIAKAVDIIIKATTTDSQFQGMTTYDADTEAELLMHEARLQPELSTRLAMLETALAIAPNNRECLFALLDHIYDIIRQTADKGGEPPPHYDTAYNAFLRLTSLDLDPWDLSDDEKKTLINCCKNFPAYEPPTCNDVEMPFKGMNRNYIKAIGLALPQTPSPSGPITFDNVKEVKKYLEHDKSRTVKIVINYLMESPRRWSASPEVMTRLFAWTARHPYKFHIPHARTFFSREAHELAFPASSLSQSLALAEKLARELSQEDELPTRFLGLYGLLKLACEENPPDYEKRRRYLQTYLDAYLKDDFWRRQTFPATTWIREFMIMDPPNLSYKYTSPDYFADDKQDRAFKGQQMARFAQAILDSGSFPSSSPSDCLLPFKHMIANLYQSETTCNGKDWKGWADAITHALRTFGYSSISFSGPESYSTSSGKKATRHGRTIEEEVEYWGCLVDFSVGVRKYSPPPPEKAQPPEPDYAKKYPEFVCRYVLKYGGTNVYGSADEESESEKWYSPAVSKQRLPSSPRTILDDDGLLGVVCSRHIILLNPKTLVIQREYLIPDDIETELLGLVVAENGFICVDTLDGIAILNTQSEKWRFLWFSEGDLPGNSHAGFDLLNGKLYLVMCKEKRRTYGGLHTHFKGGESLVELDVETGNIQTVLSNRSNMNTAQLPSQPKTIHNVIADRTRNQLLISLQTTNDDNAAWAYDPVSRKIGDSPFLLQGYFTGYAHRQNDCIYSGFNDSRTGIFTHIPTGIVKCWNERVTRWVLRGTRGVTFTSIGNSCIYFGKVYSDGAREEHFALYLPFNKENSSEKNQTLSEMPSSTKTFNKSIVIVDKLLFPPKKRNESSSPDGSPEREYRPPIPYDMAMAKPGLLILNREGLFISPGMAQLEQEIPKFTDEEIDHACRVLAFVLREDIERPLFHRILRRNFGFRAQKHLQTILWELKAKAKTDAFGAELWPSKKSNLKKIISLTRAKYQEMKMLGQVLQIGQANMSTTYFTTAQSSEQTIVELTDHCAQTLYEHYHIPSPYLTEALLHLALQNQKDLDKSINFYQEAEKMAIHPENKAEALCRQGIILMWTHRKFERARDAWRDVKKKYPDTSWAATAAQNIEHSYKCEKEWK